MDTDKGRPQNSDRHFDFGTNWRAFSDALISPQRLDMARASLTDLIGESSIKGRSFLDIGCGSGLFSLAAAAMGAEKVHGFDISAASVRASQDNLARLLPQRCEDKTITFEQGSILDQKFTQALPQAETVYAWGSLHHTGAMWQAIQTATTLVAPGGTLVLALYNRHWTSPLWQQIKRIYNALPPVGRKLMIWAFTPIMLAGAWLTTKKWPLARDRGMNFHYDLVDWIGGYPYEYASPDEVTSHLAQFGFTQRNFIPQQGWTGCAQYVFTGPQ